MTLKEFLSGKTEEEIEAFAKEANTSVAYLDQLIRGYRKAGMKVSADLIRASKGAITMEGLRPDKFVAA